MILILGYGYSRQTAAAGAYQEMVRTSNLFQFFSSKAQWKT